MHFTWFPSKFRCVMHVHVHIYNTYSWNDRKFKKGFLHPDLKCFLLLAHPKARVLY